MEQTDEIRLAIVAFAEAMKKWDMQSPDDLSEAFSGITLPARTFAQLLMEHLGCEGMGHTSKMFWLEVADHMGPDYMAMFRRVGAFMIKTDEF